MDWRRIRRRLPRVGLLATATTVLGVAVSWGLMGGLSVTAGWLWVGIGALLLIVGAVLVVSVSAMRGMLRAGDRGERLASGDVGVLPPQVRGRSVRREDPREVGS